MLFCIDCVCACVCAYFRYVASEFITLYEQNICTYFIEIYKKNKQRTTHTRHLFIEYIQSYTHAAGTRNNVVRSVCVRVCVE